MRRKAKRRAASEMLLRVPLVFLMLLACTGDRRPEPPPSSEASPPTTQEPPSSTDAVPPTPEEWTGGILESLPVLNAASRFPVLRAVRTAAANGYDRLTVELTPVSGMPGYHLEYVDRPLHQCGSGDEVPPVGDAWLELRLEPAAAHTEWGEPTLPGREIPGEGRLFRRLYLTCDFEGVVTLVLALESPNPYRVLRLTDPQRIVVDVRH